LQGGAVLDGHNPAGKPKGGKWLVILAIFGLALALRLANINAASLWIDEVYSLITANTHSTPKTLDLIPHPAFWYDRFALAWQPLHWDALIELLKVNVHVPLYYCLLNPWLGFLGNHAVGLRSFSALCSALMVFPLAALGVALGNYSLGNWVLEAQAMESQTNENIKRAECFQTGTMTGLCVAVVVALSPFQIYYGQEGRMYALLLFWASCCGLAFWKVLYGARPRLWGVFYAISLLGGFFSHYMFVFFLGFQGLYGLLWLLLPQSTQNKRERILCLLVSLGLLVFATTAWWPVYQVQQQGVDSDYHFAKGLLAPLRYFTVLLWQPLTMASGDNSWQRLFYIPITLLLLGFGLVRRGLDLNVSNLNSFNLNSPNLNSRASIQWFRREGFLLAWLFIPLFVQIGYDLLKHTHTSIIDRYVLLISPAMCVLLGLGLQRLFSVRTKAGALLIAIMAILAVGAVWSPSPLRDEHNKDKNIRAKLYTLARLARPHDLVFVNGPWGAPAIAAYYLVREKHSTNTNVLAKNGVPSEKIPLLYWISNYRGQRIPLPTPNQLSPYSRVWLFRYRANNERGLQKSKDYLHSLYPHLTRFDDWFLYSR
jgi:uncharacterized membrane protein